ncbi:MAG: orotidine-5'-phosphate decarboxylase [Bacteriovoracaceae bacterium]|nr:orotidine-5'-phosphate decarboxylase [Bacteroidota bacterium]
MTFISKLTSIQQQANSLLCVGLDTDAQKIPVQLRTRPHGFLEFNKRIIDATADLACAYKINFAFYESLGKKGWQIMEQTLAFIPSSIITIADAKRGDIGNTSTQYAKAILQDMGFDSITVAPYMGKDSVQPFLEHKEKGVFLLALTSNQGAFDFQYKKIGKNRLFEEVVTQSQHWTNQHNLGFVVGATKSNEIRTVRLLAPDIPFLVPGIGAQGGSVEDVIRYGCMNNGLGVLINASRSILYASQGKDYSAAARSEALKLNNEINFFRNKYF